MSDGRLRVVIEGRVALPVRAIPYVTSWNETPDSIVRALAEQATIKIGTNLEIPNRHSLVAYLMDDHGCYESIPANQWKDRAIDINSLTMRLKADEREDATDENYGPWRIAAVLRLPDNVFVWLDEFQSWYLSTRPLVTHGSDSKKISALREEIDRSPVNEQLVDVLESELLQTSDDSLCLSPILPSEIEGKVWRHAGVAMVTAAEGVPTISQANDAESPEGVAKNTGPVWWSIARAEGERWYADTSKARKMKKDDTPISQGDIAAHLNQYLWDKGYRGRSQQRISISSILGQISGIAQRKKVGMGWK